MTSIASPSATSRRAAAISTSLPLELTRFIGREFEIDEVRARLESGRLLTLTGAGGSGKTRLALELLRRIADTGDSDVALVELAGLVDPALLPRYVAESFDIHEEVSGDRPDVLVELLRTRRALIVLDNCEHVVDACASLVEALLRACPGLRILATSREPLGVAGERAWLVPPLSLAPADGDVATIAGSEAVRLFVDRARDTAPEFELTDRNAATVAEICRRLDGIPLAIELAAARVKVLTPEQIRDRLDDAFALLRSSARTAIPRHRTLRAAIDWSYDLLPADARGLFRRLSVFRGGFTLDAVEAMGGADGDDTGILDLVERLVDRSLVTVREHDGEARYALLETVRQYATARLAEESDAADARRRHAVWVEAVVARAEPYFTRTERRLWVERLVPELDNIREALVWSRSHDRVLHVRLVGRLWWFWFSTRYWGEAQHWIEGALELPEAHSEGRERGALLFAAGALAALQTRVEAAIAWLDEAAALANRIGDDRLEAYALNYLGLARSQTGDPRGAGYSARAQRWFREANDLYGLRLALLIEGTAALAAGNVERAESLNLEGLEVARQFGQDRELAIALGNTATVYIHRGDTANAEQFLREALHALRRDPSYLFIGRTLDLYAEVLGAQGDGVQAARVMAAADAIRAAVGGRPFKLDMDRRERLIPVLRAAVGDHAFDRAWADGATLQPDTVLADLLDGVPELEPPSAEAAPATEGIEPAADATFAGMAVAAGSATADAAGRLDVRALGSFDVRVEGERVPSDAWPYAKPKELLLLLLLYSAGRTRDQIAHALWPGATPAQAKNRFHVTLHHLRKALGRAEWVIAQDGRYRLAPEVDIDFDADRFENDARAALNDAATDVQQLRTIIDAEPGDLFEGETPAWIEEHRARLRRLGIDLRLQLGELLEGADDAHAAEAVYREVIVREEFEEEAHRRLMALRARAGSRTDALRHYERLAAHLEATLDAEPEPETIDLYERIRAAEPV